MPKPTVATREKENDGMKTVSVPVPNEQYVDLVDEAKREERSVASTCRFLLREAIESRQSKRDESAASK